MDREAYIKLLEWKNKAKRKPLILNGARQVGKTWLLKEFGTREYDSVAYINCDENTDIKDVFYDFDPKRLIRYFSAITNINIEAEKTLIILDEIQEVPQAITALKYFCEEASEYHIVVAGSLLGISLHKGTGFPVGKVEELTLYPLSFKEFLMALNRKTIIEQLQSHDWKELSLLSNVFIDLLRQYYYVGGMPEVVSSYIENKDVIEVRKLQNQILSDYQHDFSKHVPKEILPKVKMVWNSVSGQLAKENKKFIYNVLKKGARAKEFEDAIEWLGSAGLVYKVRRVSKIERPLKFYEDYEVFKLFILDLGLLGAMSGTTAKEVITKNDAFTEYKGAFTEQYIFQELAALGLDVYYYSKNNSTLEIDFVIQKENVYPIEAKAETNVRSKSLKTVSEADSKLKPVRFSMNGYIEQDWMVNVPLYLAGEWVKASE